MPILDWDNRPLFHKYPTNRPLLIWVVGYDERHIGGTIYRMLFKPDAFKIIQDLKTGEWRAWKPWEPGDKAREAEIRPAPPLIPPRLVDPKGWAWIERARRVFATCRLLNGTEIHAFSSKSEPKKGDPVDLIHIDEDIEYASHVAEWESRLSDHRGRMVWSVFPLSKNTALLDMSDRAEKQRNRKPPDVSEIVLRFSDNPYIDQDEKRKRLEGWSDVERRARDEGEFVTDEVLVYPNFSHKVHGLPWSDDETLDDPLTKVLRANGWQPPDDWCRYFVLDPGHGTCAGLFAAVPPPERYGDFIVCYDEIYQHKSDADSMARAVFTKCSGKVFEAFLIDARAGRQTPMGFNHTVQQQYALAFEKHSIRSCRTANDFLRGSDNKEAGINLVRGLLTIRNDGTTRLRVVNPLTPNLRLEFVKYRKQVTRNEIKDETVDRDNHLMDCLRYLAAFNPSYVEPEIAKVSPSLAYRVYQQLINPPEDPAAGRGSINMGPASAA
jgi:hypothetical protein